MSVEKPLEMGAPVGLNPLSQAIGQAMVPAGTQTTEYEDGSMVVDFDPFTELMQGQEVEHNENLVEYLDDDDLTEIASDLVESFEADRQSREEWEKTYVEGLDLLGLKFEDRTKPWEGACGVFHPLLTEAVVRFQAQTIQEIFPATGPAKANIEGNQTNDRVKQAHRVVGYMNYLATTEMKGYREETERLLFSLPLAGSAFRKMYFNQAKGRPEAMFVPAEDVVVNYGASSLDDCERATHVLKMSKNDLRKMQVNGFYADVDLPDPQPDINEIRRKWDKLTGNQESNYTFDKRFTLLEMLVDYNLPGFEDKDGDGKETGIGLPYVMTVDLSSKKMLGIRRNWRENDPNKNRREHFVQYKYLPGLGFYGFGLIHIIGGLAKSATSLLRQLVDSGTLSNLPGGLKARGLRIKGDDTPIQPGEWRDVDVPGSTIKDNILPLPYKEPSTVLHALLGEIVQEGRRFASAADVKVADMNNEAPVGTTLAILEREMKVLSAVMARVHASMGKELRLLAEIIRDFGPEQYPYETDGEYSIKEDFDDRIDVIPVSDPNAGTMAQRIMQHQAAIQLSAMAPELYDKPMLHRQMIETIGLQNASKIVPTPDEIVPADPVTENMALLNGKPVKAHLYQDHESHIQVHMSMAQNPQIMQLMQQNPQAQAVMAAAAAHVTEHIAFAYRQQVEKELGVDLPDPEQPLPEDIEYRLSKLVAPAAAQVTGKAQKQAQAEENAKKSEDPILQLQQKELDIKERDQQAKAQEGMQKIHADLKKHTDKIGLEHRKLTEKRDEKVLDAAVKLSQQESSARTAGFQTGVNIADKAMDRIQQERLSGNNSGNKRN